MEIEYYNGCTKHKDEGVVIRIKTDSGFVKAVCPKTPLACWAVAFGKHITPVFHLDMTPFLVEYTRNDGKKAVVGQLLYDLSKRRILKEYPSHSRSGRARTMKFKGWITTTYVGTAGKIQII